jgi:hypothetical protein
MNGLGLSGKGLSFDVKVHGKVFYFGLDVR